MLAKLYRQLIPYSIRNWIYDIFLGKILFFFRHFGIICRARFTWLFQWALPKSELNTALAFMGRHGLTSYPYPYWLDYKNRHIEVLHDEKLQLPYLIHNGKKLYFPDFYDQAKTIKDYRALITEQDERSSHRYVRSYNELHGKTLLDIGSAEGIFALDTIELVEKVIIFECEEHWLKPLMATFEPWKEKVQFVKKYVGSKTDDCFVAIDDFLANTSPENLFLKMDIEGAERHALKGAEKLLRSGKNIQWAITTYHRPGDPEFIANLMAENGYETEFSDGLMYWSKRLSKGVIRCRK